MTICDTKSYSTGKSKYDKSKYDKSTIEVR